MSMSDLESNIINLNISEISLNKIMSISVVSCKLTKREITIISRNIHNISLTLVIIVRVLLIYLLEYKITFCRIHYFLV